MTKGEARRRARVVILALAAVLVVAGVVTALALQRPPAPIVPVPQVETRTPTPTVPPRQSNDGVGDPYYPNAGGDGYDALSYDIRVRWDEASGELNGTTTMRIRPDVNLSAVRVDLGLTVDSATVDGTAVPVVVGNGSDRMLRLSKVLQAGRESVVSITYHGDPRSVRSDGGDRPVQRGDRGLMIAGEPISATAWFPSNDHPSDPATYAVSVTVPKDLQAISAGRLISEDADSDPNTATWQWRTDRPTPTYTVGLAIGPFRIERETVDGIPYVYAVSKLLSADEQNVAMDTLKTTPMRVRQLAAMYGKYPMDAGGGLVSAMSTSFGALEIAGRPFYDSDFLDLSDAGRTELVVHENAHMWFGNTVTPATWADIVMNESFATHASWTIGELNGGRSANDRLQSRWEDAYPGFWRQPIANPGRDNMFGTTYDRGAMALQALKNVMRRSKFDTLVRRWAAGQGPHSFNQFRTLASEVAGRDLSDFFTAWYSADSAPPKTAEYGWPG